MTTSPDTRDICETCGTVIESIRWHNVGPVSFGERMKKCQACAFLLWFSKKHLVRLPIAEPSYRPTKDGQVPDALKALWAQHAKKEPTP